MNNETDKKYYKIIYIAIIVIMIIVAITVGVSTYNEKASIKKTVKEGKYNNLIKKYAIEYSTYSTNNDYEKVLQDCQGYKIIKNYEEYQQYLNKMKNYNNYFHGKIKMSQGISKLDTNIPNKTFFNSKNVLLFKVSKEKVYNLEDMKIMDIRNKQNQLEIDMLGVYSDYSRLDSETGYIFMLPINKKIETAKIDVQWAGEKDI